MELEISWTTIFKFLAAGLGTYVILPAALVCRDWVLRKVLQRFILNEKLEKQITEYAWKEKQWDEKHSKSFGGGYRNGVEYHFVDGKEVSFDKYCEFSAKQYSLQHELRVLYENINSKSALINWLFKHYKQNEMNPIPEWLEEERKRFRKPEDSLTSNSTRAPNPPLRSELAAGE